MRQTLTATLIALNHGDIEPVKLLVRDSSEGGRLIERKFGAVLKTPSNSCVICVSDGVSTCKNGIKMEFLILILGSILVKQNPDICFYLLRSDRQLR